MAEDAKVYTDEAKAYESISHANEAVRHSILEYVRGQVHTNGVASFRSMLKRGYFGTYHEMGPKHLTRFVAEFTARQLDTEEQMAMVVAGMEGKRLTYKALIADIGHSAGAR